MKTFLKIVGGIALVIAGLAAGAISWLHFKKPASRPASAEKIEATPERLARGRYVVEHVSDCLGCHSDHTLGFAMPVKPGTEGEGGYIFDEKLGFPGVVAAQNITADPTFGLGGWTDGEILRAMREGVDRNGDALFPMMPYEHLRSMSDEDAKSVVVYLRTLKPVHKGVPDKRLDFPVNFIVKFIPKPLDAPVSAPEKSDTVAYGKYLSTIGGCHECHSPHDAHNNLIAGRDFSGGWEMKGPWGRVITANLTPASGTFLGHATKEEFVGRFKAFASMTAENAPATPAGHNTVMPWIAFGGMTEDDLGAIYTYLKTLAPIENKVVTFPDAK
ncbi:MAG TPA: cytochrome C [Thermoanaerobaculia bacterium]|nr:cytochrome C [Thermoanaerobaculia bacterium]